MANAASKSDSNRSVTRVGRTAAALARSRLRRMRELANDPRAAQTALLQSILRKGARTTFGGEHRLDRVTTATDLAAAVPLRRYGDMAQYWNHARLGGRDVTWPGRIRYWAISSGTTAGEKFLPMSAETIRTNRAGGWDSIVPHLAQSGRDPFGGKLLFLGGCTQLRHERDSLIGDNTGIMALHIPRLIRRWHVPKRPVTAIADWGRKIRRAAVTCANRDVRMLSGVPSWILSFCEEVLRYTGKGSLLEVWPNLSLFVHGGVAFAPYASRLRQLVGGRIWCTDTYSASEGGMLAVQDLESDTSMLPLVDRGAFYEFVPVDEIESERPTRLPIWEVEPDVDYAVVLTTNAGIYGYVVGDVVRFTSVRPLRLLFSGRIRHALDAF